MAKFRWRVALAAASLVATVGLTLPASPVGRAVAEIWPNRISVAEVIWPNGAQVSEVIWPNQAAADVLGQS